MEGHLRLGEALTMSDLANRTEEGGGVQMMRGFTPLKFSLEEGAEEGEGQP